MPAIRKVSIIGAGALGAAYGALLFDMDRDCVSFVAAGERFERLRREGVIVNGRHYAIPVLAPEDTSLPADLVIVAVKNHHLDAAIGEMKNRVGRDTIILSLMNGIDSEERIGAVYGMDKVLYALTMGIDALREGNRVIYTTQGRIFFGEAKNPAVTERVARVQALFDRAGIAWETPPDMLRTLWWKFMANVGINQASAVLRAPYSAFQAPSEARDLMLSSMREVIAVAEKAGVSLTEEDIEAFDPILARLSPEGKTSMLQDVEARRKTEVEMFAGTMIALGEKYGVAVPVNRRLFEAIRDIEKA
ncbi:MAG: 2-dehydropantoate 2-reductase [Deltaproteobacteria bacterium HGW-Deltaproteobacteria-19]|jgi:2-dehydropantoate 2-reductase|nr:MAG: 2-dehydropantoate 2-reductase [Deltaproteobacteria bacterium HGW-Deltaproteobacteria-19]